MKTPSEKEKSKDKIQNIERERDIQEESLVRLFSQTIFAIFTVVLVVVILGFTVRDELVHYSEKMVLWVGYPGLFLGMLLSDSLPAFIPPDAFLVFSIAGKMDGIWVIFSTSLGSILGGCVSYAIGRYWIPKVSLGRKFILKYEDKLLPYLRRYGFWAVVLSAMTPIPFSWMCYTVGTFKMKFSLFLGGASFRILRLSLYYYAMLWGWLQ